MDRYLITTNCTDLTDYRDCAESFELGLELQAFADPRALSGNWRDILADHKQQLRGFRGDLGLHGAFYDMNSGSRDPEIVKLTRKRYRENLIAAAELEAKYVVIHLNYLGPMKLLGYHADWRERQMEFWSKFIDEIASFGVPVLLENSWEDQPEIVIDLLDEMSSPYLRACLDVAHATIYSKKPFDEWLTLFEPYLECCHLNNHDGEHDLHLSLDDGVVNYNDIITSINNLPRKPYRCLELPSLSSINTSLEFLRTQSLA
jgi:sugar phosphate isomerase/epimerase